MASRLDVYARVGHRTVSGWIEPPVIPMLRCLSEAQADAGVSGHIAEIGVHHGRLLIALHLMRQAGEKTLAIDLFEQQEANVEGSGRGDRERFHRNVRRHAGSLADVITLAGDSQELDGDAVRARLGGPVRLFSVDGGHEAGMVEKDMLTATAALADGGIIVADDVFNANWPGTAEGTFRYLTRPEALRPFAVGFNKTLFTQEPYVDRYQAALRARAGLRWSCRSVAMAGGPVVVLGVRGLARMAAKTVLTRSGR